MLYGCAQVLKMRRPPSERLNKFFTEAVTNLSATGYPVGDHFKNGDAGVLEELFEMYDRVGMLTYLGPRRPGGRKVQVMHPWRGYLAT